MLNRVAKEGGIGKCRPVIYVHFISFPLLPPLSRFLLPLSKPPTTSVSVERKFHQKWQKIRTAEKNKVVSASLVVPVGSWQVVGGGGDQLAVVGGGDRQTDSGLPANCSWSRAPSSLPRRLALRLPNLPTCQPHHSPTKLLNHHQRP